jgi:hypothetical protein
MFDDPSEDEYSADLDVPATSTKYERLRALYARLKARHLKFAQLAQMGTAEGWPAGKVAAYVRKAERTASRAKRVFKKLQKERLRLEALCSPSGANMLAEQGAADEADHGLLSVPISDIKIHELDPEELDEKLAVAAIAGTSFGYINYAQYDPKTQMLLDAGYELEEFSVDARLDAQLRQLEEMGISTDAHMSGDDDLYTDWPTLDYAVPSDVADAGMFSGDDDFLDSTAPAGLWESGVVDEFESGDVSMGAAYDPAPYSVTTGVRSDGRSGAGARFPSGWTGDSSSDAGRRTAGAGSLWRPDAAGIIHSISRPPPGGSPGPGGMARPRPISTHSDRVAARPARLTSSERKRIRSLRKARRRARKQIAAYRIKQDKNSREITTHSRNHARSKRTLRRLKNRLRRLPRWGRRALPGFRGRYKDPIRADILRRKIRRLAPGVRNANKRLRRLNRRKGSIAQSILTYRKALANANKAMAVIRSRAHERAGNQAGKAEADIAVVALGDLIKKTMEESTVVQVAEEASDRILEAQEGADEVFTKEAELEVAVSETDLKPESLGTPAIAKAEGELSEASEKSQYSMANLFEAIQALTDQVSSHGPQGNPVFQDNPEPIETGEGGWIDVPEDWDANYYQPEYEEGYGPEYEQAEFEQDYEPVEEQVQAAQYAAPDQGQEWDDQQLRLDAQLEQLAALGVSISGDSYGADPWDQFGDDDDLYTEWPTLDYAVPSDVADAGMFSGDGYGEAFGWTPGGSGIKLDWGSGQSLTGGGTGTSGGSQGDPPGETAAPKKKASVNEVMGVLGPLINAGLNFGAQIINGAGKGGSGNAASAVNTANKMEKAAVATQPLIIQAPAPPATAAEIAAEMERRSAGAPPTKTNVWPMVGVGVAGVAVVGTAVWASTR